MKWQTVRDLGIGLYKKRRRSRTLWVGGSLSAFGLFAYILLLTGVTETHSGDSFVDVMTQTADAYVNFSTSYWRICFDDTFEFVSTEPHIRTEVFVPTFGKKWRPFVPGKDCIDRKKINKFKITGYGITETVKWTVKFNKPYTPEVDIDPKFIFPYKIREVCDKKTIHDVCIGTVDHNFTYTYYDNTSFTEEERIGNFTTEYSYQCRHSIIDVNCKLSGITVGIFDLACPANYRCEVRENEFCMRDCSDADCRGDELKQPEGRGWSLTCLAISDLVRETDISVSPFKEIYARVEKI